MDLGEWWGSLKQDVTFGLRQLRKSPGFTCIALATLALGIGANSAIFSVVHAVLLAPLPYANSNRLLTLMDKNGGDYNSVTFGNYGTWLQRSTSFDAIGAWWPGSVKKTLTGFGDPVPIDGDQTTASYWKAMYIKPILGGYFSEDDAREGAAPVVILSEALWRNRFAADPAIIGKSLMLSGAPTRVIGVAPGDYVLGGVAERIWTPLIISAGRFADHKDHELSVVGLVKRGVSFERATIELSRIQRELATQYPHSGFDDIGAIPYAKFVVGDIQETIYLLFGAVALVLLIACANVANLLIARATRRSAEIAVRGALGASRGRIIRQLLVESILIGVGGGILGLLVAVAGIRFLVASPVSVPRLQHATLNPIVVGFTLILAVGCALLFGMVPALRASRMDLQQTLREGGRQSTGTVRDLFRAALVVGELCVAQVLLIGAVLLVRSMMAMTAVPLGFDTHNLIAASISLPSARYSGEGRVDAAFQQIETAVAAIPGVKSVGRSQVVPIYGGGWNWTAMREGSDGHDDGATIADMRGVSPGYFGTIGQRFLRGREFTIADRPGAPPTAIISRELGKRLFGDADPLGKRISNGTVEKPNWREIVGVVDDIHANGPRDAVPATMYLPSSVFVNSVQTLLVRSDLPAGSILPQIRRAIASVDPLLAISNPSTIDGALDRILATPRFRMFLLSLLGATGLILAVIGVYGVISYFVMQRTHELGVRLALGAPGGAVQWLVVRQGVTFAIIGIVSGLALAFAAVRLMRSMVFGVTTHDPLTFIAVPLILGAVAVVASYIPARRATRIDPLSVLRST